MKIRKGFVSNSSSTSFIVAFPKEMKSPDDIKEVLFDNKDAVSAMYYDEAFSTSDLAALVYRCYLDGDIDKLEGDSEDSPKGEEEVINELSQRYYYCASNVHVPDLITGEYHNDGWSFDPSKYCGSDQTLLDKLEQLEKLEDEISEAYWAIYHSDREKAFRDKLGDKYSPHDNRKMKKIWEDRIRAWKEKDELSVELSKKDWENFKKDHEDSVIKYFHFSDGDGSTWSFLEHGETFKNLDYLVINHH